MSSEKAILTFGIFAAALIGLVAGLSFQVDAMCFYRCADLSLKKPSLNNYYQTAQRVLSNPDAQLIIMGSSRGQTMPIQYLTQHFGLKSLNLSVEGAELVTKSVLLKLALKTASVRRVIWLADYFDMIPSGINSKLIDCPALMALVPDEMKSLIHKQRIGIVESLLDHNNFEATIAYLKKTPPIGTDLGSGSGLDPASCVSREYKGNVTPAVLEKKVDIMYENYTQEILLPPLSTAAEELFRTEIAGLVSRGIEVDIIIAPYHPRFMQQLKRDFPAIFKRHEEWAQRLVAMAGPHLQVINGWVGIPGDEASPRSWNDGVHYTCNSAIALINQIQ